MTNQLNCHDNYFNLILTSLDLTETHCVHLLHCQLAHLTTLGGKIKVTLGEDGTSGIKVTHGVKVTHLG